MSWFLLAIKKYVDFKGRSRRKEFWFFTLFSAIFLFIASGLDSLIGSVVTENMGIVTSALFLFLFLPSLSVMTRRLHDTNKSGWFILIQLIPVIGFIAFMIMMCMDSNPGDNKYGQNPKGPAGEIKIDSESTTEA